MYESLIVDIDLKDIGSIFVVASFVEYRFPYIKTMYSKPAGDRKLCETIEARMIWYLYIVVNTVEP